MEIKDPKFKEGDKVLEIGNPKSGVWEVKRISKYDFFTGLYIYELESEEDGISLISNDDNLKPYIEKPKSVWDLKNGDTYYAIDYDDMNVFSLVFCNDEYDLNNRALGNCFLTTEEAEFEVERRKIETEMLRLGGKRKAEQGKVNWFLEYRPVSGRIETLWSSYEMRQGAIYFDSEEKSKEVVDEIGKDRIKKYIFGIEE